MDKFKNQVLKIYKYVQNHKLRVFVVLAVVGIIAFFFLGSDKNKQDYYEVIVEKGNVISTISATGNISSQNYVKLTFGSSGVIGEVLVEEGQEVKEGDLIASLELTPFEAQVRIAEGDLSAVDANLAKAQDQNSIEILKNNLSSMQLDVDFTDNEKNRIVKIAENNVDRAELQLDLNETNLDYAEDEEYDVTIEVSEANEDIQELIGPENLALAELQTDLTTIQLDKNYEIQDILTDQAVIDLQNTRLNSESQTEQAITTLEKLQKQLSNSELQLNQGSNFRNFDIKSLTGQKTRALGSLDLARYSLSKAKIIAPFDGIILTMPFKEGEQFFGGQMNGEVILSDNGKLIVEVDINELDILNIKIDQKAFIELDGLSGQEFEGRVTKISPGPKIETGVISYPVEISFETDQNILQGMTANIDFVTDEKNDVLVLPLVALQNIDGKNLVKVKNENKVEEREVEIGLEGDTEIEIVNGLSEGEIVLY